MLTRPATPSPPAPDASGAATTILAFLFLLMATAWFGSTPRVETIDPAAVRSRVNPNTAPWWELTILPGIGETRARDLVAYRETNMSSSKPVFLAPADVEQVRGIGPGILSAISPELAFAAAP